MKRQPKKDKSRDPEDSRSTQQSSKQSSLDTREEKNPGMNTMQQPRLNKATESSRRKEDTGCV